MVGRNLVALAEKEGYEVLAPPRTELDLNSQANIENYILQYKPDVVVHAAGLVGGIQANMAAPYDFCYQNLLIGLNVVNAAYSAGVKRLVNLGSSCMYPRNAKNPLTETQILQGELEPTNEGYAIAKVAVARICDYISQQHGVAYKTLIPCNLYGYWDKFDPNHSHMIPAVVRKIHEAKINNSPAVDIWGDGTVRREFMFAEDLARFILFSFNEFEQLGQYTNVGIGSDHTINEFYDVIAGVVGYEGDFEHDLTKPTGMSQKLVDTSELVRIGWKAQTSLQEGVQKTYEFYLREIV